MTATVCTRDAVEARLDRTLALAREAGIDEAEAVFEGHELDQMRLANARIVEAARVARGDLFVRVVCGGVEGVARTADLTDEGLRAAVASARHVAELVGTTPAAMRHPVELPAPQPVPAAPAWALDEPTLALDTETKAAWLAGALDAHAREGLDLAGRFHSGRLVRAVRSTTGVAVWHEGSAADLLVSTLERPAGHGASSVRRLVDARIDAGRVDALLETVRAECARARDPVAIEPGAWDVVLAPLALASLLGWLGSLGFSARAWEDGTSFVSGRLGERVTGSAINLTDDGSMPCGMGIPHPFDAEGLPRRRVDLLRGGVARAVVHDSASARRALVDSTGHAVGRSLFSPGGARAHHLHLEPGTAQGIDALVARMQRGLLVTRLHYVNGMIEPRRAVMTGLLRDAAFLVEDGRITRAVAPMRFTDSILEAFERIDGPDCIGAVPEPVAAGHGWDQPTVCPPVLVRGLMFTSGR